MVKICPKCKSILPFQTVICPKCKNKNLLIGCSKCGKILLNGERTCPICGDSIPVNNHESEMLNKREHNPHRKGRLFVVIVLFILLLIALEYSFSAIHKPIQAVCGTLGHRWNEATCTEPQKCKICRATKGESLGHQWEGGDCTTKQVCSVCGETGDFVHVVNDGKCGTITCKRCKKDVGYKPHEYNSKNVCVYCGDIKQIEYDSVEYNSDDYWDGVVTAQNLVKDRLKSPSSAKFPSGENAYIVKKSDDDEFIVSGYVEAENSFGAMLRQNWIATFKMGDTVGSKYYVSNIEVAFY